MWQEIVQWFKDLRSGWRAGRAHFRFVRSAHHLRCAAAALRSRSKGE